MLAGLFLELLPLELRVMHTRIPSRTSVNYSFLLSAVYSTSMHNYHTPFSTVLIVVILPIVRSSMRNPRRNI